LIAYKPVENHVIHYKVTGEGQPVILIHGLAASLKDWDGVVPGLVSAGFQVYQVDLLGHGHSHKPSDGRRYHIYSVYSHFAKWLKGLDLPTPPVLVGHSLGGYVGLVHCIQNPDDVRKLVLINPFYTNGQLSRLLNHFRTRSAVGAFALRCTPSILIHTFMSMLPYRFDHLTPTARRQVVKDLKRASPLILNIPNTIEDLTPRLEQVKAETLVIWGDQDLTLDPGSFSKLSQMLPMASHCRVPQGSHQPHVNDPDLVCRLIVDFLNNGIR
jgi:pimeloyl-ACP methyl ester carboxylesterase